MTVTRFGPTIPILDTGTVGYSPPETTITTPDPVDLLVDSEAIIETPDEGGAPTIAQHTSNASLGGTLTLTLGATPTVGNVLLTFLSAANGGTFPTGFTSIAGLTYSSRVLDAAYRVVEPGDGASHAWTGIGGSDRPVGVLMEITNTTMPLEDSATLTAQSAASSLSVGPVDVTAESLVVGSFGQNTSNTPNYTPGTGVTELYDLPLHANLNAGGIFVGYHDPSGTGTFSFAVTTSASEVWAGMALVFGAQEAGWVPAPESTDGDDATYRTVAIDLDGYVIRWMLEAESSLSSVVMKVGYSTAASRTFTLYGANVADFSDEVSLSSQTYTSSASYAADTVTFVPPDFTPYRFYRIAGAGTFRLYTLNAYLAQNVSSALVEAELEAHIADTSDAHDASAVSFVPTGTIAATNVQDAIAEVAAEASGATFGTPALTLGTANAAGSIDEAIRRDATILAFDATAPSTQVIGDAAAVGSAGTAAHRDHKHAITNPLTTQDDLWVAGASGAPGRLAKGSDGQVLTVDPTTHHLVWATPSSGFSDPMTTRGDLIVRNASNVTARLAVGAANRLLRSDGTDVSWGQVVEGDLGLTDITTANVSTTKHGFAPKLPNDATKYLDGTGAYSTPAGSGGSLSYPGSVEGLAHWYKADAISGLSNGGTVTAWRNSSPVSPGYDLIAVGSPTYQTNVVNSLPVVRFSGTPYFKFLSPALLNPSFAFVLVFKMSSIANAYTGLIGNGSTNDYGGYFIKSKGTSASYPIGGSNYDGTGAATFGTVNWNYIVLNNNGTTYDTRRNGSADKSGTGFTWTYNNLIQMTYFLGNQAVSSRILSGDIAEVLIYGRGLTSSEVTAIESYITGKYGI